MKKSELKDYIKEIILAELDVKENTTYIGKNAISSFKRNPAFATLQDKNSPINTLQAGGSVTLESEDEEPTEDDIRKGTETIDSPTHAKKISPEEKEKFKNTKKLINILIGKLEEYKKDKEFENWIKKSSYASELLSTRGKAKEWIKKNIGVYTKLGANKPTIPA